MLALDYSAHPSADAVAATIAARYAALPGIERVALIHRVGSLVVGDLAIVAAVSAAHRAEAFQACADLVEEVNRLPRPPDKVARGEIGFAQHGIERAAAPEPDGSESVQ